MAASSVLPFSKIVATGNDFLFIDARAELPEPVRATSRPELALRMCDRNFGAGADGLVFVEEAGGRLRWDFYNNDGSHAEMCGNASRCMGRWAATFLQSSTAKFDTVAGPVRTRELGGDVIASHLDYFQVAFKEIRYIVDGTTHTAVFLNTGVPHAVVTVNSIEEAKAKRAHIQALRFHADVGERGTNVTFLQIVSVERFATVTFERGVEDFTLSCGTGVLAAAAVGLRQGAARGPVEVKAPGGTLKVSFGEHWRGAVLEGSARLIYEGRFQL